MTVAPLNHPRFEHRLSQLSVASDRIWISGMVVGLGFTLIAAFFFAGSPSGNFWAYAGLLIRCSLYLSAKETAAGRGGETLTRLFYAGLAAGLFEILIDWALIHWVPNGKLVYLTGNDVVLLGSPIWMPVAWACVLAELSYLALRLYGVLRTTWTARRAAIAASMATAITAGITVGFYEYFAYRANWWRYQPAHAMLGRFCALYIPLGEFFMFLPALPIAAWVLTDDDHPTARAIGGGTRFGLAIAAGYALAYVVLEVGRVPR